MYNSQSPTGAKSQLDGMHKYGDNPRTPTSPAVEQLLRVGEVSRWSPSTSPKFGKAHDPEEDHANHHKKSVLAKVKEKAKKLKNSLSKKKHNGDDNTAPSWGVTLEEDEEEEPEYFGAPMYESEMAPEDLKETARQHPREVPVISEEHVLASNVKRGIEEENENPPSVNKTLTETVTEKLAPAYATVSGATHAIVSKIQGLTVSSPATPETEEHSTLQTNKHATLGTNKNATLETNKHSTLEPNKNATLVTDKHATLGINNHATLDAGKHATLGPKMHGTLDADKHATLGTNKLATLGPKMHATLDADQHATLGTNKLATLDGDKHANLDAGKHATLGTNKLATLDAGKYATIGPKMNATPDADKHANLDAGKHATPGTNKLATLDVGKHATLGPKMHPTLDADKHAALGTNKLATLDVGKHATLGTNKLANPDADKHANLDADKHAILGPNMHATLDADKHATLGTNKLATSETDQHASPGEQVWDKGVSVKEYLMHKLEPGEDERALSQVIVDAMSPRRSPGDVGVVEKVKGAVTSLLWSEEPSQSKVAHSATNSSSHIPISTNAHEVVVEEENHGRILQAN